MDRYEEEKQARKKSNEMFNSITEKVKPETRTRPITPDGKEWDQIQRGNHVKHPCGCFSF